MIYANHNFLENYASADGRKDAFMKEQIIVDEIARLITNNKIEVIKLLRKHGVNATYNDTSDRVVELVLMLISQNDTFVIELKKLILSNNKKIEGDAKYSNAVDELVVGEDSSNDASTGIGSVIKGIGKQKANIKKGNNPVLNSADLLKNRVKLADAKINKKSFPVWAKWTLIGLGSASLVGIVLLIIRKMRNGGTVNPPISTSGVPNNVNADDNQQEYE
jgi:hypothetical protein